MPETILSQTKNPYNMCVSCVHLGSRCDGPNFLAMDMEQLCEWCRLRKSYLHNIDAKWTNQYIAEESEISKVSVDRFMAGGKSDLRISTISRIIKVLVNGTWGEHPCAREEFTDISVVELVEELAREKTEREILKEQLEGMKRDYRVDISLAKEAANKQIANLENQILFQVEQIKNKDQQLTSSNQMLSETYSLAKRKDKTIAALTISTVAASLIAVGLLLGRAAGVF